MSDERLKVAPPNYTQIPNVILDNMNRMSGQCFNVLMAVCRETFGWHKEKAPLSINDLAKLTGLSRQGVINGVTEGVYNGVLQKERVSGDHRDGFNYSIQVQDESATLIEWTPISAIQKAKKEAEKGDDLPIVNSVDYTENPSVDSQLSSTLTVNSVDRHIRVKESIKESSTTNVVRAPSKNPQKEIPEKQKQKPQPIAVDNPVFSALREALGIEWDSRLVTKEQRMNVTALAKSLLADGETPERVTSAAERMRQTWPWCNGERITVKSFRENYHAILKQEKNHAGNSSRTQSGRANARGIGELSHFADGVKFRRNPKFANASGG